MRAFLKASQAYLRSVYSGVSYDLQPYEYIIGPAAGNPNLCLSWPMAAPLSSDGIDWQIGTGHLTLLITTCLPTIIIFRCQLPTQCILDLQVTSLTIPRHRF